MQLKIAVVGGGIMGSFTALKLKQKNIDFNWFPGSLEASASIKAGGMVAPYSELDTGERWLSEISEKH